MTGKIHHITPDQMAFITARINKLEAYIISLRETHIVNRVETQLSQIEDIKEMLDDIGGQ